MAENLEPKAGMACIPVRMLRLPLLTLPLLTLPLLALAPFLNADEVRPDAVRYDAHGLIIDGKPTQVYSGAFHYFRCPKLLWRERFKRIKEAGFNAVETYAAWNVHETLAPADPKDFSKIDMTDLVDWMKMAHEEFGLNTIIRPGPYICAEWNFGGYPRWLYTKMPAKAAGDRPTWLRSDDPSYLDWSQHWMDAVAKVVVPEQVTRKPKGSKGVILFQIENEYDFWQGMTEEAKETHLARLHKDARAAGIDVPIFTCWTHQIRTTKNPELADVFDAVNLYNRTDIAGASLNMDKARKAQPTKPGMVAELQGGWFANVGGQLSDDQEGLTAPQINAITMAAITHGASITNYYMLFGGSHFGREAGRGKPATYDYNAPIRETGAVGDRYARAKGIGAMLAQWGEGLVVADKIAINKVEGGEKIEFTIKRNAAGETFVFAFNQTEKKPAAGTATLTLADGSSLKVEYNLEGLGYQVCRLAKGESDTSGKPWLPRPGELPKRPDSASLPKPIRIAEAKTSTLDATGWKPFADGTPLSDLGDLNQLPVAYRTSVTLTATEAKTLSGLIVDMFANDRAAARINGVTIAPDAPCSKKSQHLDVRGRLKAGANTIEIFYEDLGSSSWDHSMENRYGVKAARLAASPRVVNLAEWRSRLVADVAEGRKLAAQVDDGKGDAFTFDALTLGELNGVHQPGADMTRVAPALLLKDKKAVALYRAAVNLTAADINSGISQLVFECLDDSADIFVNGRKLDSHNEWSRPYNGDAGKLLKVGKNEIAVVVSNNTGEGGITKAVHLDGPSTFEARAIKLEWAMLPSNVETPAGTKTVALDTTSKVPDRGAGHPTATPGQPLVRHEVSFDLPADKPGIWVPWLANIAAAGNGQLYLNGHHIGRYWQAGMQRAFYLPECWLKPGAKNTLVLEQLATSAGNGLGAVEIAPDSSQAEVR